MSGGGGFAVGYCALGELLAAALEVLDKVDVARTHLVAQTALDTLRKCAGRCVVWCMAAAAEPKHFLGLQVYWTCVLANAAANTGHGWLV